MKNNSTNETGTTTEQAINDVLKVERDAQQQITQCVTESEQILEQARQTARHIGERNNSRITLIHQRCSRKISDDIACMQAASKQIIEDKQVDHFDITVMSEVLDRIALALTTTQADKTGSPQHSPQQKERK
jgi:F0F1-type ATP synthase membrane subunit b/b'